MNQNKTKNRLYPKSKWVNAQKPIIGAMMLIALTLCVALQVEAKVVTGKQALNIARKYVSPNRESIASAQTRAGEQTSIKPYYVFNDLQGKGFVVVAGDDAMGEILAYGHHGTLDTLNAHPGIKFLLQTYRESFNQLQQTPSTAKPATRVMPTYKVVKPLLTCNWSQDYPYNKKLVYPYTGCVATAVAQLMYYHKWPTKGKGKNSYTVAYYKHERHADFSKSRYDWAQMKDEYTYGSPGTVEEEDAVALLMSDVGTATYMQYTPSQSGAQNEAAEAALKNNFDYTTAFVARSDEGMPAFVDIVRQELTNGFPVYLSGNSKGGGAGHAWVTDGIDDKGLFHMNFGWGGQSNGYFSLATLSVEQTGNEFGGRPMTYRYALIAILAHPNKPNTLPIDNALMAKTPKLKFNIGGSLRMAQRNGDTFSTSTMPIVEMNEFVNYGRPFKGDIGVGVFDMDGKLITACPSDYHAKGGFTQHIYGEYTNGVMGRDYSIVQAQKIKVNLNNLADGYYQLLPICAPLKEDGSWDKWINMRQAPRMVIEIGKGKVRIVEEDFITAGFQLTEQPSKLWLKPGKEETIYVPVRNKGGLGFGYFAKLQLLDDKGNVAFEAQRTNAMELEGFRTTWMPFNINVPNNLKEGNYKMKLMLIKETGTGIDDPEAERFIVEKLYNKDETVFFVSAQPTGIDTQNATNYSLTNNQQLVTVHGKGLQRVRLYTINGLLINEQAATHLDEVNLSLAHLVPGVYIVQVMANNQVRTHRLFKR